MQLNICEEEGGRAGLRPGGACALRLRDLYWSPRASQGPTFYLYSGIFWYVCPQTLAKTRWGRMKVKEEQHQ